MEKIITLFQRNYETDRLVRNEVVPGAEWVLEGKGVMTRKFDGTSCLFKESRLWKRYDAKKGKKPPADFFPAQPEPDAHTGHWPGWVPVSDDKPEDQYHREAFELATRSGLITAGQAPWSYELIGPKVQGNAEHYPFHTLIPHGKEPVFLWLDRPYEEPSRLDFSLTFEGLRDLLAHWRIEGIVWWLDPTDMDSPKVKLKRRDFGLPWPLSV